MQEEIIEFRCRGRKLKVKKSSLALATELFDDLQDKNKKEIEFGDVDFRVLSKTL